MNSSPSQISCTDDTLQRHAENSDSQVTSSHSLEACRTLSNPDTEDISPNRGSKSEQR